MFLRLFSAGPNPHKKELHQTKKRDKKNQKAVIVMYITPSEVF